jgi:hypothetical protein
MHITWKELAVDLSGQKPADLMSAWRWLIPNTMALRMVSSLGDGFLEDDNGAIHWLDVGGALLSRIADSREQFDVLRQQPENGNKWFVPQLVGDLLSAGKTLQPGQCFSYKVPPTLGGAFAPENFAACDLSVHFQTIGQMQEQVKQLPATTVVDGFKIDY